MHYVLYSSRSQLVRWSSLPTDVCVGYHPAGSLSIEYHSTNFRYLKHFSEHVSRKTDREKTLFIRILITYDSLITIWKTDHMLITRWILELIDYFLIQLHIKSTKVLTKNKGLSQNFFFEKMFLLSKITAQSFRNQS